MIEGLVKALRLQLPLAYRLPLHVLLLLLAVWPAILLPELVGGSITDIRQRIALFPVAAAVGILALLPAVWIGSGSVRNNGTPWTWPLYPWSAFVFLLIAVCLRSYSLTMSFDVLTSSGHYWDTAFGMWLLTPIFMATLFVLLEMGITEGKRPLQQFALISAPLLLPLSWPWLVPWSGFSGYQSATGQLLAGLPSPVYVTLLGLVVLFLRGRWKQVPEAGLGLFAVTVLATIVQPDSFRTPSRIILDFQPASWLVFAIILSELLLAIQRRSLAGFWMAGSFACGLGFVVLKQFTLDTDLAVLTMSTLWVLFTIVISEATISGFGEGLKEANPIFLIVYAVSNTFLLGSHRSPEVAAIFFGTLTVFVGILAMVIPSSAYRRLALLFVIAAVCGVLLKAIQIIRSLTLPAGIKPIVLGTAFFVIAVLISSWKAGLGRRLQLMMLRRRQRIRHLSPP